jgi:carboxylesterase type B
VARRAGGVGAHVISAATTPPPRHVAPAQHVLWIVEYIVDLFQPLGCMHGSELVMVFDLQIALWGTGEATLADTFVDYWTNFAATGNPNGATVPVWQPYTSAAADNIAQIDTGAAGPNVTTVNGLRAGICQFWGNITIPPNVIWG